MTEFVEKLIQRLGKQYHFYTEDNGFLISLEDVVSNIKAMAEEYKHCCLCYFGSPCEYQNEEARLPASEFADDNGWILCSEMLPEEKEIRKFLVMDEEDIMAVCHFIPEVKKFMVSWDGSEFTDAYAWQPLPTPYQPKGE